MEEFLLSWGWVLLILSSGISFSLMVTKPRAWEEHSHKSQVVVGGIALTVSWVVSLLLFFFEPVLDGWFYWNWMRIYPVFALLFVLIVSLYTDVKYRHVRSDILWVYTIFAIPFAIPMLLSDNTEKIVFVLLLAVGLISMLFPAIGQSDSRAFILSVLVIYPLGGGLSVISSLVYLALIVILYAFVTVIIRVGFKEKINRNISLPLVPLLVFSFLLTLLLGSNNIYPVFWI